MRELTTGWSLGDTTKNPAQKGNKRPDETVNQQENLQPSTRQTASKSDNDGDTEDSDQGTEADDVGPADVSKDPLCHISRLSTILLHPLSISRLHPLTQSQTQEVQPLNAYVCLVDESSLSGCGSRRSINRPPQESI